MVRAAQIASHTRLCVSAPNAAMPLALHDARADDSDWTEATSSGPSLLKNSRDSGMASRCSSVCSTTSLRRLVRRSRSWSARAITTSPCLTRPSLMVACSVSRWRSAFTASDSGAASGPGLTSSGASSFLVSARSLRAKAAAAIAAARTSEVCSRSESISAGSRLGWSARPAIRSSWRVHRSTSWENGRCGGGVDCANTEAAVSRRTSPARLDQTRRAEFRMRLADPGGFVGSLASVPRRTGRGPSPGTTGLLCHGGEIRASSGSG